MRDQHSFDDDQGGAGGLLRQGGESARGAGGKGVDGRGVGGVGQAIRFTVPGTPVGKGRPKFARRGAFVTAYTPEKTASYENLVKVKAEEAMTGIPVFAGPVEVWIDLIVAPPASWSQKKQRAAVDGQVMPTTKPDIDNVLKGIMDACNEIVWKDDKQACDVTVRKRYGVIPRALVQVRGI